MVAPQFHDAASPVVPAAHQPAVVLEHLRSLDVDPLSLQLQAGLAGDPVQASDAEPAVSPLQLLALLRAAARTLRDDELSFQLGRQWLPGHYGAASHALLSSGSLRRALTVLARHPTRLSPLLVPHLVVEGRHAVLHWTDACGSAGMRSFLVELQMSAVAATCHWLAGQRLPWTWLFNRGEPASRHLHETYLGSDLRFGCQLDAMVIDVDWLDRPWANPRAQRSAAIGETLDRQALAESPRRPLLALLYTLLEGRVARPPGLEEAAAAFGLSPATFKRRLAACGTHFQAELDQVRLHAALRLLHGQGLDTEAIGRHLGFDDAANFRRSMKRWSGLTPAQLRLALLAAPAAPVLGPTGGTG